MLILGICGPSGSGKTRLSKNIAESLISSGIKAEVLAMDCYYKSLMGTPIEQRAKHNFDAPESFDYAALAEDLSELSNNCVVYKKQYDYANFIRLDPMDDIIMPPDVLILEGIHVFSEQAAKYGILPDLRVFVDTPIDICLIRRANRDLHERGYSLPTIFEQYQTTVRPMYEQYIRYYKEVADISVINGGKNPKAVGVICAYILSVLNARGKQA